jgi:hypothetical protein
VKTKAIVAIVLFVALAPMGLIVWYRFDSSTNHGLNFGYYGSVNRLKHALTTIDGITITREWANEDVTIEEFGFDIATKSGQTIRLNFQESDQIRVLSGERLTQELTKRIDALERQE